MAVGNKFKLNVIAASVLMGLSLSAVASAQAAETTPVKSEVKTLAEMAAPLASKDADAISVTVNGSTTTLGDIFNEKTEGSVAELKGKYETALTKYNNLPSKDKEAITTFNKATAAKETAAQTWGDFVSKLSASDSVYNDNLDSLYGKGNSAFTVGSDGSISSNGNAKKDTTYGQFLDAYDTLAGSKGAIKNLNDSILSMLKDGKHNGKDDINLTREAKIVAYSNYLQKYAELETAKLKADSVRNVVIQHIAGLLSAVDANPDVHSSTTDLTPLLKAFNGWKEKPIADNEAALAVAFKNLVNDSSYKNSTLPDSSITWGDVATAWDTAATGVASAETSLAAAGTASGMNTAIQSVTEVSSQNTLTSGDEPKDFNDALAKLKAAYTDLLGDGAFQNDGALAKLIANAQGAQSTLDGLKADYLAKVSNVNQAGAASLNLLLNELPDQQKAFFNAQKDYLEVVTAYEKTDAKKVQEGLYGADGKSGALNAYLVSLKATSEGIQDALKQAGSDYSKAVTEAKTQEDKNKALYKLISTQKTLAPEKLNLDTQYLNLIQTAPADATSGLTALKNNLDTAAANKANAKAKYVDAVKGYLAAEKAYQTSKSEADAVKLATAQASLMTVVGISKPDDISKLYVGNKPENGFKQFDELTADNSSVISKYNDAVSALATSDNGGSDIQKARAAVVDSMKKIAGLMPLSTSDDQKTFRTAYNNALKEVSVESTTADEQSKAKDAGKVTHILGSLSGKEIADFDVNSGNYKSIIVNVDKAGNVTAKDNFTANDLYTGTKDKPFTTTVLDIRALELSNGDKLSDTNTITVGEAGTKDKKATPVEVWAKTTDNAGTLKDKLTPAVKLSGELRTATAPLDENGKPMEGQIVRGADQIHLQNVNIYNSFTLADKVKMLADDVTALNQQAADKLALGQPAKSDEGNDIHGVNDWLRKQNDLLNVKYDNLQLTGLQIDTSTVNPSFNLTDNSKNHIGEFVNTPATVAPADANILLDNLNITLQNDSVGGISTAIDLSGTGNHILANGGVFDAGKADNLTQANVLDITGENNTVDFTGSTLKGDIRSSAAGNEVNLKNGSNLTGDVSAINHEYLSLNLDGSTWTGGAGTDSPDVSLSNNSVWNVKGYDFTAGEDDFPESSVNSLTLHGSNTLNLVNAEGQAQLGGRGFVGSKYGTVLSVDHDLVSDGKGVTSVLAGTYSPDNLHGLTNTGLAGGYQFGGIYADGLATGGKYALSVESSGAEPYTIGGRLADGPGATSAHEFVSYKTSENRPVTDKDGNTAVQTVKSDADFTSLSAPAELGVYQYAAEKVMDGVNNRTNIYYSSTGKLSNSAATVVSLAAAPVDVANLESDTLAKHMNSVRHGKDSGVWVSYFGGENRNTTAAGPEYTLKTNGVMLGVDTLTENNWLAGVAVSSARSDMSVMNSSGDLNSYGAQFYMSRRYDSGVFVDSALQFNHFSNTAKARMTDGQQAKADFSGNSYGLEAKVGYAWNSEGFFAEPYVRAAARAFDGEHYALSNGMTVNSNDYKSMLGEVGADLGYQYAISGGYVKPYLHLAALNEFADGNSVRVNNVSLDNSVKGAAFQAGLGAEVKVTDNLGGYAAFDYTKGDNTERPWQATVGVNYTW